MIYTIGHKESYEQYFEEYGDPGKKGRTDDYPGGSVFKNMLDAVAYCPEDYSVYGVIADWENDTVPSGTPTMHNLLIDSSLVKIKNA